MEKNAFTLKPVDGAEKTLRYLKENGIRVAVGSGTYQQHIVEGIVEGFGWKEESLVDIVIGTTSDGGKASQEEHHYTKEAMSSIGVYKPEQVAKIADSRADILEGKHAGVFTVGLLLGGQSTHTELKGKPDFVLEHVSDVPLLFEPELGTSYEVEER